MSDLTPPPEPTEVDQLAEALAADQAEADAAEAASEEAELEIGPEKVKVHKSVKEAWDGLQKTIQSHAEGRSAAEKRADAEAQKAQDMMRMGAQVMDDFADIKAIDKQLEPYLKLTEADWIAWGEQDAAGANKTSIQIQALMRDKALKQETLNGKIKQLQDGEAKTNAERKAQAEAALAANIKDWSPTKEAELKKGAEAAYGINATTFEAAKQIPGAMSVLADALTLRAARAKMAAKPKTNEGPPPEPVKQVRGNTGGGANDLRDSVPIDQWAKNFRKSVLHQK